jgi:PIN domain
MIVLLDTTVLLSDALLRGTAWRVLAQAASAWNLRVFVPEVAIIEASAGYQRMVADAQLGLERWNDKHSARLGPLGAREAAEAILAESASSYPARLRESLAELNATVVAPPDIGHLALVERAANRRRPCNSQGDGYRDTLNWFSLLDLVSEYPEERIAWISDNTKDFGTDDGSELHDELRADLTEFHAEDRVFWVRNLQELVLLLAAEHAPETSADLELIQASLRKQVLGEFLKSEVLATAVGATLDPRACGLPIATTAAKIALADEAKALTLTVRGAVSEDEAVVEFGLEAETSILIELPADSLSGDPGLTTMSRDAGGSTAHVVKSLIFAGLITLDKYGRPTGAELTRVSARQDDPGRMRWTLWDISRRQPAASIDPSIIRQLSELKGGFKLA